MIQWLVRRIIGIVGHKDTRYALIGMSLLDGSIAPLPPDLLLIPMILAKPSQARKYTLLTILFSAIGGIGGYCIGYFAFEAFGQPMIQYFGYEAAYANLMTWFKEWGVICIILASIMPIPYKLWTITAGVLQMQILPFMGAVCIARTIRFSLVAYMTIYGARILKVLSMPKILKKVIQHFVRLKKKS